LKLCGTYGDHYDLNILEWLTFFAVFYVNILTPDTFRKHNKLSYKNQGTEDTADVSIFLDL